MLEQSRGARSQQKNIRSKECRFTNVVRHENHGGGPTASHAGQKVLKAFAAQCIESGERFIHKEHCRLRNQRAPQCEALTLTAGKRCRPAVFKSA